MQNILIEMRKTFSFDIKGKNACVLIVLKI